MPAQTIESPSVNTVSKTIEVPLNRVEGDLAIRVSLGDGCVSDAWSSGTMYRGIENIMIGRGPLDGLVITPRICGICSTAHLQVAAQALDRISGTTPPPDALRIRNLALMTELLQSDMRQCVLMFMPDFCNASYKDVPLYEEAVRRYAPLKGESVIEVIKQTKSVIGIVAILGGQWPHSSYMIPGGVATIPSAVDLFQCRHLLTAYQAWYEKRILGCCVERWQEISRLDQLDSWLEESAAHQNSDLGFFIRYARQIGLDAVGRAHSNFICAGGFDLPEGTAVRPLLPDCANFLPAGFARGTDVQEFCEREISEHVEYSWFEDYEGGKHPFEGETKPYATGREGRKYSWAKAPRYQGEPAETGPLAEMIVAKHPLFVDIVQRQGATAFARSLARMVRPAQLIQPMHEWLSEITPDGSFYVSPPKITEGQAYGLAEATRGALGHWVKIENGKIAHYQIITPTAWNGSPRDSDGVRGPWEEALVETPVKDPDNPVELGHVIRSFDPCLVCTVHSVDSREPLLRVRF